jgi:hypothetical protein
LIRNIPLTIQGLGVVWLILKYAYPTNDRVFKQLGVCILLSYGFYLPVILFVQRVPLVGMLMIPKTLAYLAAEWIGYRALFTGRAELQGETAAI